MHPAKQVFIYQILPTQTMKNQVSFVVCGMPDREDLLRDKLSWWIKWFPIWSLWNEQMTSAFPPFAHAYRHESLQRLAKGDNSRDAKTLNIQTNYWIEEKEQEKSTQTFVFIFGFHFYLIYFWVVDYNQENWVWCFPKAIAETWMKIKDFLG